MRLPYFSVGLGPSDDVHTDAIALFQCRPRSLRRCPKEEPAAEGFQEWPVAGPAAGRCEAPSGHIFKRHERIKVRWLTDIYIYIYSDESLIRTRLFPINISRLTSFPDY